MSGTAAHSPMGRIGAFLLALLCSLYLILAAPPAAYADNSEYMEGEHGWEGAYPTQNDDGEWVHSSNGLTWEETKEARYHDSSASADDWDDRPLGGEAYPGFDILNPFIYLSYWVFTLFENMSGTLISICNELFAAIGNTDAMTLQLGDSTYASVYSGVKDVISKVIVPVADGFLGLALVIELLRFSRDVATNKGDHFSMAGNYMWILVKFAAMAVLISHTDMLCEGIYELFLVVAEQVRNIFDGTALSSDAFDSFMLYMQEIPYKDFGNVVIMWIASFAVLIAVSITVLRVLVLMVTRMFEVYVRMTFAGFPLIMVASREMRESGLRYFKEFAGVCLQAAVLIVMISFAGVIMSAVAPLLHVEGGGIVGPVVNILATIAGVMGVNAVIGQSRALAEKIMGA